MMFKKKKFPQRGRNTEYEMKGQLPHYDDYKVKRESTAKTRQEGRNEYRYENNE